MSSQTFYASGTFTVPGGITSVDVQAWGEGGNGAAGVVSSHSGGGGGGGGYAAEPALAVTGGSTLTITIGTGGAGTNTQVGGGGVTVIAYAGTSGSGTTGGTGGTGSFNSVTYGGGSGGAGISGSTKVGGGGGSGAGTGSGGNSGNPGTSGGAGGSAPSGGGAGGAGSGTAALAGSAPGGGGGGGGDEFSESGAGGDGAAGQVVITWTEPAVTLAGGLALAPLAMAGLETPVTLSGGLGLAPLGMAGATSPPTLHGGLGLAPLGMAGALATSFPFPSTPLGVSVQLLINGTWTDVTSCVLERSDITISRGRPDETQQAAPSQCTLVLANRDGRFSPNNPNGALYPFIGRNTQLRVYVDTWSEPYEVQLDEYPAVYGATYGSLGLTSTQYTGYRFWGEVSSWAPGWDPSGTDIYVSVTASGPLRRYSQGNAKIGSALRRYYARLPAGETPYGYWPAEDASGSDEIASGLSGGTAMGFTGTPDFGSDSAFGGSDSIPSVNGSLWHGQTAAASTPPGTGSLTEGTPGTFTWTCPPGVYSVAVTATGAGAGGGASGTTAGGGGGGGGGFSSATVGVTPGTAYTYTVPAGGQAGTTQGTQGTAGGSAVFTGDTETVTGGGGQPGLGGNTSTGGAGGTGSHAGGAGANGSADETTTGSASLKGYTGGTGLGYGGTAGSQSVAWTAPAGVTTASVRAGAAGSGGEGGGAYGEGYGGGGGGGGGLATGTINTTPGSSYTFYAGDGGSGGNEAQPGEGGGDSYVTGDDSTQVHAHAGSAGSGPGSGGGGGGDTGSAGGNGARAVTGEGMGGGGGGGGGGGDAGGPGGNAGTTDPPRSPGYGEGNGAGGGWGAVSNGGNGATPGGVGGAGTLGVSGGGGGGGGGAVTNTTGLGAGGGGGGWIEWSWSYTGPVGGGGGSSAGPSSAGSAGNANGTGGTAVTGGGAGGNQGLAGTAPGGGGGGGIPSIAADLSPAPAGNGAPGQVTLSWSGGTVSPVAADIVRFLLDVDAAGATQPAYSFTATHASPCVFTVTDTSYTTYASGLPVVLTGSSLPGGFSAATTYYVVPVSGTTFELSATYGGASINSTGTGSGDVASEAGWVVARAVTYGTAARLDVVYNSTGTLELIGYSASGSVLFDSGAKSFGLNGTPVMVDAELTANAAGTEATWTLAAILPGAASPIATYSGTVSGITVGYVSDYYVSPNSDVTFASAGQMSVQTYADPLTTLAPVISGYNGELASARLARLSAEEGFGFELTGSDSDTPMMGPQQDDTFVNVVQSCEDMDQGQVFESRDQFGLAYRTRVSMQGQSPALTLNYAAQQLANKLEPTADDQFTRNDIEVTRNNGSSVTLTLASGAMSVQAPPNGCGDYTYSLTVYGYSDAQLTPLVTWLLSVGTVADERYPVISADLSRPEVVTLFAQIPAIDIGDFVQVTNPPTWLTASPIQQLCYGFSETLNSFRWTTSINAVPAAPWNEGNPPAW